MYYVQDPDGVVANIQQLLSGKTEIATLDPKKTQEKVSSKTDIHKKSTQKKIDGII
jgi:hypothetical protein